MREASKASWITVLVGLGSNLRDRSANIRKALTLLTTSGHFHLEKRSLLYETEPVGPPQPNFLNGVAQGRTDLSPEELLKLLKKVEKEVGREEGPRWGPRVVDLDILFCGELVVETPFLTIPHPRLQEREFVLVPLAEIAPSWRHPRLHKNVLELLEALYLHETHPASRAVEAMEPVAQASRHETWRGSPSAAGRDGWFRSDDGIPP